MDPRPSHPDDMELELARTGEAGAGAGAHVRQCGECADRLEYLESLAGALKPAEGSGMDVPEMVEARILRDAGRAASRIRRKRWRWVAAAAILLLVGVPWLLRESPAEIADVNSDGIVDILDAFVLAKQVETGCPLKSSWDFDGSGQVNRSDADFIAMSLVQESAENLR